MLDAVSIEAFSSQGGDIRNHQIGYNINLVFFVGGSVPPAVSSCLNCSRTNILQLLHKLTITTLTTGQPSVPYVCAHYCPFQQGTLGDNTSLSSGPKANPDRTTTIPPQPSSETNLSSDPLSGMSLSARVSLFMQIRQGQAKAKDLLPDSVLSLSLRSLALAKETQRSSHHEDYGAHNAPISGDRHGRSNNREFGRRSKGCRATAAAAEYAPSGILHQFIKHVKPFSLHLDDAARECNTTAVLESPGSGAMSVDHFEGGGDDPVVISENHRHSQATETPRRHDTGDDSRQSTEDLIFGARRLVGSVGKGQQKSAGGQSGAVDVPRKPKVPTEVGEDMCRANTSLQGKRKLAYSFPASPDGGARLWSVDLAGRAAARNARKPVEMATSAGPSSQGESFDGD